MLNQDLRHALRVLRASPGLHRGRDRLAGARHRRQHRHLQPAEQRAADARCRCASRTSWCMLHRPERAGRRASAAQSGERSLVTYEEFLDLQAQQRTLSVADGVEQQPAASAQARIAGGEPEESRCGWSRRRTSTRWACRPVVGRDVRGAAGAGAGAAAARRHEPRLLAAPLRRPAGRDRPRPSRFATARPGNRRRAARGSSARRSGEQPDAWMPLAMQATVLPGRAWLHDEPGSVEKVMWLHVFGRLRAGARSGARRPTPTSSSSRGWPRYYGVAADAEAPASASSISGCGAAGGDGRVVAAATSPIRCSSCSAPRRWCC